MIAIQTKCKVSLPENGGPTRPEDYFLSLLVKRRKKKPTTKVDEGLSIAEFR